MKTKVTFFRKTTVVLLGLVIASFVGCVGSDAFRDDLPDTGSQEDTTFPEANFDYTADQEDFRRIYFTDLSSEANTFAWDFGGGATSTDRDPEYTFEDGEGIYAVSLTASDANGVSSSVTLDVEVVDELIAAFECPDFLCDPRTPWGGGRGTSTYSGSGSPTPPEGNGGAKISSSSQFLDQTIRVVAGANYRITFWYVSAPSSGVSAGELLIEDGDTGDDFLALSIPRTDQSSAYVETSFSFATGDETENMRFNIEYGDTEVRISKISIERI